jgi:hypothetical protein
MEKAGFQPHAALRDEAASIPTVQCRKKKRRREAEKSREKTKRRGTRIRVPL